METENEVVVEIIRLAVQAGGCWNDARNYPTAARGLESQALRFRSMAMELMNGVGEASQESVDASPPTDFLRTVGKARTEAGWAARGVGRRAGLEG